MKIDKDLTIGLALSGGGARAIAFHLGCLRALNDRGILEKVKVISTVSGGSVIGALYSYSNDSFEEFDNRVVKLLSKGLAKGIFRHTFFSRETIKILFTFLLCGIIALPFEVANVISSFMFPRLCKNLPKAPFPRFASMTTAFASYLKKKYFGNNSIRKIFRGDFELIINATELTTQTALRYGSKKSWSWRFGEIIDDISIAKAVAASAAYPFCLPAIDEYVKFKKNDGNIHKKRVIVSDGGIYDNLGISCFFSNSKNKVPVEFIIACVAGQGLIDQPARPYWFPTRILQSFNTLHNRPENMMKNLLHKSSESDSIKGFIMPFLGQQDNRLEFYPPDLVPRHKVVDYPTNFFRMKKKDIELITKRGEQLTNCLIDTYYPEL